MLALQVAFVCKCLISHRAKQQLVPPCVNSSLYGAGQVIRNACCVCLFFFHSQEVRICVITVENRRKVVKIGFEEMWTTVQLYTVKIMSVIRITGCSASSNTYKDARCVSHLYGDTDSTQ